jgi:hypothetical protein
MGIPNAIGQLIDIHSRAEGSQNNGDENPDRDVAPLHSTKHITDLEIRIRRLPPNHREDWATHQQRVNRASRERYQLPNRLFRSGEYIKRPERRAALATV